jgi:hypothetical protein
MSRRVAVLLFAVCLALSGSTPLSAAGTLEPLVQEATGVVRQVDSTLQARAAVRAVEIQTDWGHCCVSWGEGEIIAWNSGQDDPISYLVGQWIGSPEHHVIMFDPDYDRIGCATSYRAPRTYGVCLFADSETRDPAPTPAPGAPAPAPAPAPVVRIPNTSMR